MADYQTILFPLPFEAPQEDGHPSILFPPVSNPDATKPTIGNFSPPVGTPLARGASISFDVIDETSLRRVLVLVTLGGSTYCVHDGFAFRDRFVGSSSRSAIAGGFRYTVKRDGGWTEAPTFEVLAIDTSGNEAE